MHEWRTIDGLREATVGNCPISTGEEVYGTLTYISKFIRLSQPQTILLLPLYAEGSSRSSACPTQHFLEKLYSAGAHKSLPEYDQREVL